MDISLDYDSMDVGMDNDSTDIIRDGMAGHFHKMSFWVLRRCRKLQ